MKLRRRLVDLAGLEFKGWPVCVDCGGGGTDRVWTIASLPPTAEWRTRGSRVMVIRIEDPGVRLDWDVEEGSELGKLGETILKVERFYRDDRLQDPVQW